MKYVVYVDDRGYKQRVIIRDEDSDSDARYGIPAGPPDLRQIDWDTLIKDMNNVLADLGIYEYADIGRIPVGMQAALAVVKRALIQLYRQVEITSKE